MLATVFNHCSRGTGTHFIQKFSFIAWNWVQIVN